MNISNDKSEIVEVKFYGTEIDRIVEFCNLLDDVETGKMGIQFIEGELEGITPIPSSKTLKMKFQQAPASISKNLNYRRTFEINLDRFNKVEVGGRNAVREDIALEMLKLIIKCKLGDLPVEEGDLLKFFKNVLESRSFSHQNLCILRKYILAKTLTSHVLERLKDEIYRMPRSFMNLEKANALVTILEDINDINLLVSIAEKYRDLDRDFRKYFSRCLKTVFAKLPSKKRHIPSTILAFVFDKATQDEESCWSNFSDEERMWVCEAFWFLNNQSISIKVVEKLIDIFANKKLDLNIRAAALKSTSRLLEGKDETQRKFRETVESMIEEEGLDEFQLVLIDSLAYAFDIKSPPNGHVIKKLTKMLKHRDKSINHEDPAKGVSALTLSKLIQHIDSNQRVKKLTKAFNAISQEWLKTEFDKTRRAYSLSLINFLFYGFPPNRINFEVLSRNIPLRGRQWSILKIHNLENERVSAGGFIKTADLPSMVVASIAENFDLTIKISHLLREHYSQATNWSEFSNFLTAHAYLELMINSTHYELKEISNYYKQCNNSIVNHKDEYQFLLDAIKGRMQFVQAFREKKASDKEQAVTFWTKIVKQLEDAGESQANVDKYLAKSILTVLILSRVDLKVSEAMAKMFHISYQLRDACNCAHKSFSKGWYKKFKRKEGLAPPPKLESPYYENPLILLSPPMNIGIKDAIELAELGYKWTTKWRRKRIAKKVVNDVLPALNDRLGFSSFRLIGLLSSARDVVW
ncbi:MAG: hypothetical protein ACFFFT_05575 [Candidatus Thorarchaeota archaeon]